MDPADPPSPVITNHPSLPLRCWAEIDLAALERNLRHIRASLPPHIRYVAVVKADAYGHGLQQVAGRLMHAGADLFAVANITEAAQLRELGPGWPILLLSPLLPDEDRFVGEYDVAVTVSTLDEVARLEKASRRQDARSRCT
jgi:alanine racemase